MGLRRGGGGDRLFAGASRSPPAIKPDAKDLLELARQQKIVVKMEEPKSSPTLLGSLARMAAARCCKAGWRS